MVDAHRSAHAAQLEANRRVFSALVRCARQMARHRGDEALVMASVAAAFAWQNHPGSHRSVALERLAVAAGRRDRWLGASGTDYDDRGGQSPTVLYVLTEAYLTGGHTRLLWRWIDARPQETPVVAITRQGRHPLPRELRAAVKRRQGWLLRLDKDKPTLHMVARRLRALGRTSEAVVLVSHPHDLTPLMAWGSRGWGRRPPIAFVNHADHAFWLGTSIADVVVCVREEAEQLAIARRGLTADRLATLPIPIDLPPPPADGSKARHALGLEPSNIIVLTVAASAKFGPGGAASHRAVLAPALAAEPRACALVVGPPDQGEWRELAAATGGRARALGHLVDPAPAYAAADVYLDSHPFGSITSLLEAASYRVPVVTFTAPSHLDVLTNGGDPAVRRAALLATDVTHAGEHIARLVGNHEERRRAGAAMAAAVHDVHGEKAFRAALGSIHDRLAGGARAARRVHVDDQEQEPDALDQALVGLYAGADGRVGEIPRLQMMLNYLDACEPVRERALAAVRKLAHDQV